MIARYTRPELGRLWTDEARMEAWRRVEVACAEELEGPSDADLEAMRERTAICETGSIGLDDRLRGTPGVRRPCRRSV